MGAKRRMTARLFLMGIGLSLVGGLSVAAAMPSLTALSRVEHGQWQLKSVGTNDETQTLCLTDPRVLLHYRHDMAHCQHVVVTNDINTTTVHYTCQGSHGQTMVKVATPRSFNLDTQGIIKGAPFEDSYEARYIGQCSAASAPSASH